MPTGDNIIEQIQSDVSDIEKSLKELKTATLSEADKKAKTKEIKERAETKKQEIEAKIKQLDGKQKERAETLLKTLNDIINLQLSIGDTNIDKSKSGAESKPLETKTDKGGTTTDKGTAEGEKKGFFGKIGDGLSNMRSDVRSRDKWKEQPGKNLCYGVGTILTGYALYRGVKGIWNRAFGKKKNKDKDKDKESGNKTESESSSKEDNTKEEKSFWDKPVGKFIKGAGAVLGVGSGAYYLAHGLYTKNRGLKDLWDWEKGKKLEFDAALEYCKGAIANQNNKEGMSYGMDLKFHEDTSEIEAYGQKIKIDKDKRKIVGVGMNNIEFKKYENMISAAVLIAYLKKEYSGQCKNNNPFYLTGPWQGDINVNMGNTREEAVDGTGDGGKIVGVTAGGIAGIVTGIFGGLQAGAAVGVTGGVVGYMAGNAYDTNNIMHDHMPELDSEYGKKNLQAYLNSMGCRQARNQTKEDLTESPIKDKVWEFVNQIQKDNPDLPAIGGRMQFDAIQDSKDKNKYTIKAYGREIKAEITGNKGSENMRILSISGGKPAIKADTSEGNLSNLKVSLKEGLYMTALIGQFVEKFHHKGVSYPYFNYTWKGLRTLTGAFKFYSGSFNKAEDDHYGIYFNDKSRTWNVVSGDFWSTDSMAYTRMSLKKNMPTIFKDDEKFEKTFIKFLNDGITDDQNVSIWKKK